MVTWTVQWKLFAVEVLLATLYTCSSRAESPAAAAAAPRVWLYSLVATDYDGHLLLEHFLNHYRDLGISDEQMHFDLLHDPQELDYGLQFAIGLLSDSGIDHSIIEQNYLPTFQDIQMIRTLHRLSIPANDWIIVADTDEFFTYGFSTVQEAVMDMDQEGATFAMGEMLDHVARDGQLHKLKTAGSIWDQYPLLCPVVSEIAKGLPAKVTIHKGFLRTGAGHHHIVDPALAKAYFSETCLGPSCELVMKTYKQRSSTDVFDKTPYFRFHRLARRKRRRRSNLEVTNTDSHDNQEWQCKQYSKWTKAHHFKWHEGLLENLRQRTERDSGDCRLGANEETCNPVFKFWKEVARQYAAVSDGGFNVTKLGCRENVDTLWNW